MWCHHIMTDNQTTTRTDRNGQNLMVFVCVWVCVGVEVPINPNSLTLDRRVLDVRTLCHKKFVPQHNGCFICFCHDDWVHTIPQQTNGWRRGGGKPCVQVWERVRPQESHGVNIGSCGFLRIGSNHFAPHHTDTHYNNHSRHNIITDDDDDEVTIGT